MTWFGFIHLHVDGLNVTPHLLAIISENKVKEDLEIIHSTFPLGRSSQSFHVVDQQVPSSTETFIQKDVLGVEGLEFGIF